MMDTLRTLWLESQRKGVEYYGLQTRCSYLTRARKLTSTPFAHRDALTLPGSNDRLHHYRPHRSRQWPAARADQPGRIAHACSCRYYRLDHAECLRHEPLALWRK